MARELPIAAIKALVGTEVYVSGWKEVTQAQIDGFAAATGDHQWIHVDPAKAARGPFGKTIAHGFLTLSHIPFFSYQGAVSPQGAVMTVNYGLNKVRFPNPVTVGSRIRDRIFLANVEEQPEGRLLITTTHTIEIEGEQKPACVAESLALFFLQT
jgi:acyl dehydratase